MKDNFEACLNIILKEEMGFVNDPADPGGMTNLGITKAVYEDYVGHSVSEQEMRHLTTLIVKPIYKKLYWDKVSCDSLPCGLDLCVFDFAVNAGNNRAARYLQRIVGAKEDGIIGITTIAATHAHNIEDLIESYQALRVSFYKELKTFSRFGKGWLARVAEITTLANSMVHKIVSI